MKSIIVGITGASGSVYAQRLLARLDASPEVSRIDLVITQAGVRVVGEELGMNVAGTDRRVVRELLGEDSEKVIVHSANDIGAMVQDFNEAFITRSPTQPRCCDSSNHQM